MYSDSSNSQNLSISEDDDFFNYLEQSQVFKRLKQTSAMILFEDSTLREKITSSIRNIRDTTSQNILSSSPEAVLPLSILFQSSSNKDTKQIALRCLKRIVEYQEELIEYIERNDY